MPRSIRTSLAILVAIAFAVAPAMPSAARSVPPPAPEIHASVTFVACHTLAAGGAGVEISASTTAIGTTIRYAELMVGQLETVTDRRFVPFDWSDVNTADWFSRDSWTTRSGPTSDARTMRTWDPTTFNEGTILAGIWNGGHDDSWWLVSYSVTAGAQHGTVRDQVRLYVDCPEGTTIPVSTLEPFDYTTVTGAR